MGREEIKDQLQNGLETLQQNLAMMEKQLVEAKEKKQNLLLSIASQKGALSVLQALEEEEQALKEGDMDG
jgi:hypothetical protein